VSRKLDFGEVAFSYSFDQLVVANVHLIAGVGPRESAIAPRRRQDLKNKV
jgi:hypothetical protein